MRLVASMRTSGAALRIAPASCAHSIDHLLAVVDDQHQLAGLQVRGQRLDERAPRLLAHAQDARSLARHQPLVANGLQIDEPHPVRVRVHHRRADLQREARLAEPPHAEQSQQPRPLQHVLDLVALALASDERGQLLRQVVRRRLELAQRRKLLPKLRMHDLEDCLGGREPLQPHAAEIEQRHPVGEPVLHRLGHRPRHEDLLPVRRPHDPRRAVDRGAEIVVVALVRRPGVQSAAHLQRQPRRRPGVPQPQLDRNHRRQRVRRRPEHRVDAVAGGLDDAPGVALDRLAQYRVVARDRLRHQLRLRLPQRGAPLDVGEEKRRRCGAILHAAS
jgi:hypothetical protein